MIWVVDASVAVRWLLQDEQDPRADAVLRQVIDSPRRFAVPELFCYETYAVLCRLHPSPVEAFLKGVIPILQGGILRSPMTEDLARDAGRFVREGLTGYDACYAALATQLEGVWLTFDATAHQLVAGTGVSHLLDEGLPASWPQCSFGRHLPIRTL